MHGIIKKLGLSSEVTECPACEGEGQICGQYCDVGVIRKNPEYIPKSKTWQEMTEEERIGFEQ